MWPAERSRESQGSTDEKVETMKVRGAHDRKETLRVWTYGLTGAGVFALEGNRSDWLSPYIESRYAEAVKILASDTSAAASDENAGAP